MARNVINLENVAGYAKYGDDYTNIIEEQRKKKKKQQEKEDSWTDFSAFEDGYQFGDVSKAILGTGVKTGQNFTKGLQSNLEGLLDFGTNVASMGTEALGLNNATEKLRNFAQKDFIAENDLVNKTLINTNPMLALLNQGIGAYDNLKDGYDPGDLLVKNNQIATLFKGQGTLSKGLDKIASNSITGNKLDSLAQTVGQIAGQATLGSAGLPWQVTAFANSAGNEMNNAFQNNATAGQAFLSGLISGAVEVGTEYIGGGANKLLGMESLGSKGLAKLGSKISNKLASRLLKIGIDASSEGLEEVLSGLGTAIGQKLTYMNDKELEELYSKDQALDDFIMGALGTVITNVPGQVQSVRRGENAFSGLTENEQTILDKAIEERTNEAQKGGKELTKKELNEIEDQAREDLQNGYISADMIEETLGDNYNADKDVMLRESFNERTRRRTNFNTDLSQYKNESQRKIIQKAIDSGILNDSKKTHNFVDLVSKIAADKGMDFDFVNNQKIKDSGFGVEGKTVNGYVNGNTIGLNIESNNALNKTVGHEITHVLEGSDMYQALQDSLRSYVGEGEWQSRLKSLSDTYKNVENADVTKELTADLVGENLFNNEDFVRSLSTKNRNLFEKIYDEIKYMVKIATAGSKEKRDLVKLQKTFQEAYRDSKTTKEGTQYSIAGEIGYRNAEEYIRNNFSEKQAEKYLKVLNDNTKWFRDKNGDYKFEFDDSDLSVKQNLDIKDGSKYKLKDILKHDSLFAFYPEIANYDVVFKNKGAKVANYNDSTHTITINPSVIKAETKKIQLEGILLHEIQHAIQHTEGFEAGESMSLGKKAYYNSLGEIEAADTAYRRYMDEETREKIAPESSKQNPEHMRYNEYLQNRNLFDKIRDDIRDFIDKRASNDKTNKKINSSDTSEELGTYSRGNNGLLQREVDNTSFSLEERVSGDKLLDAQDLIQDVKDVGAEVDDNGYVTVYHQTTNENAQKIRESGEMYSNEPYVFFSTSRDAQQSQGRGETKLEFKIPAEDLILDDLFSDNADVKVDLKGKKTLDISNYLVNNDTKYSLTDNQGRQLSEQQQEYFKDSKVRDEDGNLLTAYHGTKNDFTVFDTDRKATNGRVFGKGIYFTLNEDAAKVYAKNKGKVMETYLNITNPLIVDHYNEGAFKYAIQNIDPYNVADIYRGGRIDQNKATQYIQSHGYDGIQINEDGKPKYFVAYDSNQIKNIDNLNPTENDDIRYQLGTNEIAPTQGWNVRGEDIRLQSAVQETIAPLQEQVQQLQSTLDEVKNNIAPIEDNLPAISEQEASQLESQFNENDIAPIRDNLTEQESKRLDFLDRLERENMLTEDLAEERNELMTKEENAPEEEDMTPIESLNDVRDMDEVAKDRSTNAYQYEHPEVKPYFQEEARVLLAELNEVIPGERFMVEGRDYLNPTEWKGYKRQASEDVANLLDGYTLGTKYTKDQLREGLNAIIEDHGLENKAVSKRLEFMLDDRLRNGYETIEGYQIEPNQDYLNMLKEQSWDKYYDEAPIEEAPNDIRYSAEDEFDLAPFEPQERDVMEMVDNEGYRKSTTQNRPPIPYKQKSGLRQTVDAIKSGFVNRNVEIDNLSRDSGNRNIKFYGDMMNSAMGEVSYDIGTAQTNNKGETVGKSIKALFEKAKRQGLGAAFNDFLINYSNIDRYAQNKGSQTPLEVSKRLVRDYAIKYPEFKQWAKDVWTYGKNARQNLVDAGLIDQQLADYLGEIYPHYVPYVSDYENADRYFEGVGELIPKGLKRAKGNAGKLLSVEDALARYTYAQKMAIRQNDLYKEIVHTLGQVPSFGIDERTDYTDMRDSLYTDSRGNYLTAYENGKQITTQVSKDLFKELSRTTENQLKDVENKLSLITKPLQYASKWRKSLITTWNPTFPVTNAIKDLQDALFNSKHTKDMVKNYLGAVKELATGKGKEVNQFLALYGSGLTMGEYSSDGLNKLSEKIPLINTIKQINEVVELAPRYAEFKASLQNGESLQEAIYNAREVTTNFNRGGTIAKAMNRNGFTFLNASIQGFDKFIRNFSGENGAKGIVQALAKTVALGIVPALFNHLAYDDDEEYEELKDYIKDNYYLIKTGDGKFIRIPKGRMLSVFGSAARRALESANGEEDAFEGYLGNAWNQVGINDPGENNIFAPFIQAFGSENGNAWYGGDIVPSRLQDKPKGEQYDETTDKFSIWLGGKLGVSPKKINYFLDQYSGGIGDVFLPMGTEAASSDAESVGEYLIAPWKDKFTANTTDDSKYVSDFYSKKDEITARANSEKATDEDILKKKYMDYVSSEMTELYKQKREVQSNQDLTKKEKYNQASEVKKQINGLAKDGLNDYTKVEINGNYAEVNGIKYKKGTDGKWTKQRK